MSEKDMDKEGPGAATAPKDVEIIELEGHGGHALEPDYKRLPIGPDHILYPIAASLGIFQFLLGEGGHHLADDMPEDETHPFFPDHFWPYPVIMIMILIAVGLLAGFEQKNLQLEASADPRAVTIPRPDWYFLFLFQFLKLGNEFVFSIGIGTVAIILLVIFPFLDQGLGPKIAHRLGWKRWPVPGRNIMTGTIFVAALLGIALLEAWALAGPNFCVPWFVNSPVCGA